VALGRPLRLVRIRERRPKPGLQPQHLTVVRALVAVSGARVEGDALDSTAVTFVPQTLRGGHYRFDVEAIRGSAGSVSLIFQALLLPLSRASAMSRLTILGGTHVPWSPTADYLTQVFLPALDSIGLRATVELRRWGFYPAGGGEIEAVIEPGQAAHGFAPPARVADRRIMGLSAVSRLPRSIAERQRRRTLERLEARGLTAEIAIGEDATARSPGTVLFLAVPGRAGFSALGRPGLRAEAVADQAVEPLLAYLASGAAVDTHLADQLVPFLAFADEPSEFTCPALSTHLETVAWVIEQFLPGRVQLDIGPPARVRVTPAGDAR
jgi:RNA 3'-terminal phosphate cyclase (ATP)